MPIRMLGRVFFSLLSGYLTRFIANTVKKSRSGSNKFRAGESESALCEPAGKCGSSVVETSR